MTTMLEVNAQGDGYAGNYVARKDSERGWCFIGRDCTYLTPGIGKPMYYPTQAELLAAVQARPRVKVKVLRQAEPA